MSDKSAIEWTDATWNPLLGCSKVSAGCQQCYAVKTSYRLEAMGKASHRGLTIKRSDGSLNWSGEVRLLEERLDLPLTWRKPRRVFVNSMSDLFHETVPDEFIDRVFATMALARQHTFQLLTKRPERMLAWMRQECSLGTVLHHWKTWKPGQNTWPLPNVWLGVSAENQATLDARVPLLLQTPAAVRFVSFEPLLGRINATRYLEPDLPIWPEMAVPTPGRDYAEPLGDGGWVIRRRSKGPHCFETWVPPIQWAIVGCESGPCARPMHEDWVRQIRDQCRDAGVALFYKQAMRDGKLLHMPELDGRVWAEFPSEAAP